MPPDSAVGDELDASVPVELAVFDDLLRVLSEALDVREVLPRVSDIVKRVLPHDRMLITFISPTGSEVHGASNDDGPAFERVRLRQYSSIAAGYNQIIGDLTRESLGIVDPPDLQARFIAAGYRSALGVRMSARDQLFSADFLSKTVGAFTRRDLVTARRVAEHLALSLSHEQLAEAARRVAEAHARAERLELRVKSLTEQLDSRTNYGRVVGKSREWKDVLKKATQVAATDTTVLLTGRVRHRQRGGRAVHFPRVAAPERALRGVELRRAA